MNASSDPRGGFSSSTGAESNWRGSATETDREGKHATLPFMLPFFEFVHDDASWMILHDRAGYVHQEPPEFEEFGPAEIFDSEGHMAVLGVKDWAVVIEGWSAEPDLSRFDARMRRLAPRYMPGGDFTALDTFELRDRLADAVRQWDREHTPIAFVQRLARDLWRRIRSHA